MSIGNQLKKARQKKQLTIDEVYKQIKISPDMLSALEADNFQNLANPVYVKSFLKEYARFLGLDVEPLIKDYQEAISVKETKRVSVPDGAGQAKKEKSMIPGRESREKIMRKLKPLFALIALAVLVVFSFRLMGVVRSRLSSWRENRVYQASLRKAQDADKQREKPPARVPADKPPVVKDGIVIPIDARLDLSIKINDDVWAEIKRDGDIIFKGILKKDTTRNWQADENFEIWTGNASVMELSLNGYNLGTLGRGVRRGIIVDRNGIRK